METRRYIQLQIRDYLISIGAVQREKAIVVWDLGASVALHWLPLDLVPEPVAVYLVKKKKKKLALSLPWLPAEACFCSEQISIAPTQGISTIPFPATGNYWLAVDMK